MLIADACFGKGFGQRIRIELRIVPGARDCAHIDELLNAMDFQQREKLFDWSGRMADGPELIRHEGNYATGLLLAVRCTDWEFIEQLWSTSFDGGDWAVEAWPMLYTYIWEQVA